MKEQADSLSYKLSAFCFGMLKTALTYINIVRKIDKEREALFFHYKNRSVS